MNQDLYKIKAPNNYKDFCPMKVFKYLHVMLSTTLCWQKQGLLLLF